LQSIVPAHDVLVDLALHLAASVLQKIVHLLELDTALQAVELPLALSSLQIPTALRLLVEMLPLAHDLLNCVEELAVVLRLVGALDEVPQADGLCVLLVEPAVGRLQNLLRLKTLRIFYCISHALVAGLNG
jgi:hypothetical protein